MSCEQCTQGYVLPGEPKGIMVDDAYFHAAPEGASTRAIILLTDIFGLPLKNSKLIADELSKRVGCDVWVPDLFAGSPPFTVEDLEPLMPTRPYEQMSLWSKLSFFWLALTRGYRLFGIRASIVDPRVSDFVKKIKVDKSYEKIGAVGYCFGGSLAVRFGDGKVFDSIVICHPGKITLDEVKKIKIPSSWVCAEDDMTFKKELREQAEAVLAARKDTPEFVDYEFKDYKGTIHGFAARPNLGIPEVVEAYKGALDQITEWFKKTL